MRLAIQLSVSFIFVGALILLALKFLVLPNFTTPTPESTETHELAVKRKDFSYVRFIVSVLNRAFQNCVNSYTDLICLRLVYRTANSIEDPVESSIS